jgi:hypothetical protein
MSREEVEKGREVWPPNIEKILSHYYKAEVLDPKDFMTYKDRARLFHVLRQHEKSKEEYQKWFNLGSQWEDEVTKEIEMREIEVEKKKRFKKITPWEYLEIYFAGDTKINPNTRGMKKKSIIKKMSSEKNKSKHHKKILRKRTTYIPFRQENPKKVFNANSDENEKMRLELNEKFGNNVDFKKIFPNLEINLKKLSDKKILEIIANL